MTYTEFVKISAFPFFASSGIVASSSALILRGKAPARYAAIITDTVSMYAHSALAFARPTVLMAPSSTAGRYSIRESSLPPEPQKSRQGWNNSCAAATCRCWPPSAAKLTSRKSSAGNSPDTLFIVSTITPLSVSIRPSVEKPIFDGVRCLEAEKVSHREITVCLVPSSHCVTQLGNSIRLLGHSQPGRCRTVFNVSRSCGRDESPHPCRVAMATSRYTSALVLV